MPKSNLKFCHSATRNSGWLFPSISHGDQDPLIKGDSSGGLCLDRDGRADRLPFCNGYFWHRIPYCAAALRHRRNLSAMRPSRQNDHRSPERSNSSCMRSTIVATACTHLSRSAFPNFIPLMAQLAPELDFALARSTKTPMNNSQEGSNVLTASVIANCKIVEETNSRPRFVF
jgi:hypothetical protein